MESRRQSARVSLSGAYGAALSPVPRFRIRMYRGLLISYESLLADAEDLVENSRDEQNSESEYDDEEYWIDHETRVLSYFRQCASRPRRREQVLFQLGYTGNRNVSFLLRESVDKLHHLSVVVADYVRSLGSHHLLRVTLALVDGCQYSGLGWFGVADAAALEYSFDELFDLCLQHLIGNGLI